MSKVYYNYMYNHMRVYKIKSHQNQMKAYNNYYRNIKPLQYV